jgi:uncharacterized protein (DUF433 family)
MPDAIPLLTRPIYPLAEAARLARIPSTTLRRWLDGHHRTARDGRDVYDPPVLRVEPIGSDELTWGEFVESLYLRAYRSRDIPLQKLRKVVLELRDEMETPFPLATHRLLVSGRDIFRLKLEQADAKEATALQTVPGGQQAMWEAIYRYLETLTFTFSQDEYAIAWRPVEGGGLVRVQPDFSFGAPVVESGVRTDVLHEAFEAGESVAVIADSFQVPVEQVEAAIRFETRLGTKPAPAAA